VTREERHLRAFMAACAVVYAVGGLLFLALNDTLLSWLNDVGTAWGLAPAAAGDRFWLSLSGSMMMTIAACASFVAKDVRRHREMCVPVIVAKAVSTAAGLVFFFSGGRVFACLVIAFTDFPLFAATLWLYRRARVATQ
jgi:hypothetical protein